MLRLKDTKYPNTAAFLGSAIGIAEYYGFRPLEEAPRRDAEEMRTTLQRAKKNETEISFTRKEERPLSIAAKRCVALARVPEESLLLWRTTTDLKGAVPHASLELHVIGTHSAIAEALLIVVANTIAEEAGFREKILAINNLGGIESSSRYVRDVGSYLRKHIESISPTLRPRAATDPLGTLV